MADEFERGYEAGRRRAALTALSEAMRTLSDNASDDPVVTTARHVAERNEAISSIRMEMDDLGIEQTFQSDLHLSDIIEKHLVRGVRRLLEEQDVIAGRYKLFLDMAEDVAEGLRPNKDLSAAIDQEREFLEG